MTRENAAKKLGKTRWAKHLRPCGKRASAKIIRQSRKAAVRRERDA